jgi:predicted nucleic-acid-binding protein
MVARKPEVARYGRRKEEAATILENQIINICRTDFGKHQTFLGRRSKTSFVDLLKKTIGQPFINRHYTCGFSTIMWHQCGI